MSYTNVEMNRSATNDVEIRKGIEREVQAAEAEATPPVQEAQEAQNNQRPSEGGLRGSVVDVEG
ncbi:MAG: hypothetical protein EOM25_08350 [Deltaproteobacteria bacterium]|nr:hypothetical protein [Deltaproteobacteria bacterium]